MGPPRRFWADSKFRKIRNFSDNFRPPRPPPTGIGVVVHHPQPRRASKPQNMAFCSGYSVFWGPSDVFGPTQKFSIFWGTGLWPFPTSFSPYRGWGGQNPSVYPKRERGSRHLAKSHLSAKNSENGEKSSWGCVSSKNTNESIAQKIFDFFFPLLQGHFGPQTTLRIHALRRRSGARGRKFRKIEKFWVGPKTSEGPQNTL